MEIKDSRRANEGFGVWWNLVHLTQGLIVLSLLWNFVAHAVNTLAFAVGGSTFLPEVGVRLAAAEGIDFCRCVSLEGGGWNCEGPLPEWLCVAFIVCTLAGLGVYALFKLVCWTEWVKEEITWKDCWEDKDFYNPWDWVTTLVCVVKKGIQWVLKKLCKYIGWVVLVAVVACIIGSVVVAA